MRARIVVTNECLGFECGLVEWRLGGAARWMVERRRGEGRQVGDGRSSPRTSQQKGDCIGSRSDSMEDGKSFRRWSELGGKKIDDSELLGEVEIVEVVYRKTISVSCLEIMCCD
jgi:hypothetical protein